MKTVPAALQTRLQSGVTTLAHAWTLTRRDGLVLGFTDHDRDLVVNGVSCTALTGFSATAANASLGFAVGSEELEGALSATTITDADLDSGKWDGARLDVYQVDWRDPAIFLKLRTGTLGQVTRADHAFRAEVRGPAARLDTVRGRLYMKSCDADFADSRCGVNASAFTYTATITGGDGVAQIYLSGIEALPSGWLTGGRATVTSGASAGLGFDIADHAHDNGITSIAPWRSLGEVLATGLSLSLRAGCDKQFATCRDRFANAVNFRGTPHMPGNDFVLAVAASTDNNDGGVLF